MFEDTFIECLGDFILRRDWPGIHSFDMPMVFGGSYSSEVVLSVLFTNSAHVHPHVPHLPIYSELHIASIAHLHRLQTLN
jgi:hypothetical protein